MICLIVGVTWQIFTKNKNGKINKKSLGAKCYRTRRALSPILCYRNGGEKNEHVFDLEHFDCGSYF